MESGLVTTPFGRRVLTLGMLASQMQAATLDPDLSVDKWRIFRALCEVKTRLGLTDRSLAILNALLSFYPKTELSAAHGLVVFPSNAQLCMRANGMSEPTLRRHLAVLVASGLIIRKDSANGKRYARRGGEGRIDEAFGFSLSPLVARAEEIEILAADVIAERLHLQRLRERLTICRRDVAKLIEAALEEGVPGNWEEIILTYRSLSGSLSRQPTAEDVSDVLEAISQIKQEILNRLESYANTEILNGNPFQYERHIQNSNSESLHESEPLLETKQMEIAAPGQKHGESMAEMKVFPLSMVVSACPDIVLYGPGGRISSWRDLMGAAVVVRTMLGVSPSAYEQACAVLGPENASAAIACILEKGGQINSAGGYLRDLTRRAERGEFSLGPMLMALLRARGGHLRLVP